MPLKAWDTTAASNNASPPNGAPEGMTIANVNNVLRQVMADVRTLAAEDTIASATTCDLGSKDATFLTVSGTTTITGFGTVSAGIYKFVRFSGALTLTHNATNLILLTGASRTTVAGDCGLYKSEGSGNWREYFYSAQRGYQPLDSDLTAIAALTTTAYGRAFLELADQAALLTAVGSASETASGVVELATSAETVTGTADTLACHPVGVVAAIAASAIGVGQSWGSVSRTSGVSVQNTTGKPIVFSMATVNAGGGASVQIDVSTDNLTWTIVCADSNGVSSNRSCGLAIVPDNHWYKPTFSGTVLFQSELA